MLSAVTGGHSAVTGRHSAETGNHSAVIGNWQAHVDGCCLLPCSNQTVSPKAQLQRLRGKRCALVWVCRDF